MLLLWYGGMMFGGVGLFVLTAACIITYRVTYRHTYRTLFFAVEVQSFRPSFRRKFRRIYRGNPNTTKCTLLCIVESKKRQ